MPAFISQVRSTNLGRTTAHSSAETDEIAQQIQHFASITPSSVSNTDTLNNGTWDAVYTTIPEVLSLNQPSFMQCFKVLQKVDMQSLTGSNIQIWKFGPFQPKIVFKFALTPLAKKRFRLRFTMFNFFGLFKVNVQNNPKLVGSLDVLYLDEDVRIVKSNKGNVTVMVRVEDS